MWRRTSTICVPRERAFRNATVSMSAWAGMGCFWYIWVRGRVVLRKSKLQCTAKVDSFIDAQLCAYVIRSPTPSDALPKYGFTPQLATFHAFRRRRCSRLLWVSVCFDESIEVDGTYRWQTWERAVASVGRTLSTIHSADALTNMDRFTQRLRLMFMSTEQPAAGILKQFHVNYYHCKTRVFWINAVKRNTSDASQS